MSKPTINTQHTASYAQLYELLSVAANAIKACISKKDLEDANRATAAALVQLSEQTANNQTAISGKVDKVLGKGLSQNDFTDDLKARLEGLNNYNDTEVRGLITSLQSALDTLSGTNDTTDVIDSMNEIKAFLDKFKNNTKLSNVLATLEETIKAWVEAKGYLTTHQDISGKADANHNHDGVYAEKNHTHSQYLTQHQSLDGKADKSEVDTLTQVISAAIVQLAEQIANNTTSLTTKVDKVSGKGLSTNDYSNADKAKLDGIDPTSFASKSHTHTEYASANHAHDNYADKSHSHSGYAASNHSHSGYVAASDYNALLSRLTLMTCGGIVTSSTPVLPSRATTIVLNTSTNTISANVGEVAVWMDVETTIYETTFKVSSINGTYHLVPSNFSSLNVTLDGLGTAGNTITINNPDGWLIRSVDIKA